METTDQKNYILVISILCNDGLIFSETCDNSGINKIPWCLKVSLKLYFVNNAFIKSGQLQCIFQLDLFYG